MLVVADHPTIPAPAVLADDWLTLREAASAIKVHPTTLIRAIKDGKLRAARAGRNYRIRRADLSTWIGA